jgi:hypothetical protein
VWRNLRRLRLRTQRPNVRRVLWITLWERSAADARKEVIANTIQDLYFWSNIVSLTLLVATSATLVFVLRTQDKREIIAANLISQLWNGRVIDRQEIVRRTGMYNALVEAKNAALAMKLAPPAEQEPVPATVTSAGSEKPLKKSGVQMRADVSRSPSSQPTRGEIGGLPSLNVEEKSRLLESQNQALRDVERNLRERLNQLSQDLEQERLRNQALKGA